MPQVSLQLQVSPTVALGGYDQFRWEGDRLPASGACFSTANIPWGSGQNERVAVPGASYHDKGGQLYGRLDFLHILGGAPVAPGQWSYRFPEGIRTCGFSVSRSLGELNLSAEGSIRQTMPLRSTNMLYGFPNGSLADRWDANGELWRTLWTHNVVAPEIPATVSDVYGVNDLLSGTSFVFGLSNEKSVQRQTRPKYPDSRFTPEAIAGESVR